MIGMVHLKSSKNEGFTTINIGKLLIIMAELISNSTATYVHMDSQRNFSEASVVIWVIAIKHILKRLQLELARKNGRQLISDPMPLSNFQIVHL